MEAFDQTAVAQLVVKSKQRAIVIVTAAVMNMVTDFKCLAITAEETRKPELLPDAACVVSSHWITAYGRAKESVSTMSLIHHKKNQNKTEIFQCFCRWEIVLIVERWIILSVQQFA